LCVYASRRYQAHLSEAAERFRAAKDSAILNNESRANSQHVLADSFVAHSQFAHRANYVPPPLKERDDSQDDMYRDWILAYTSNEIDEMSATSEGLQVVFCLSALLLYSNSNASSSAAMNSRHVQLLVLNTAKFCHHQTAMECSNVRIPRTSQGAVDQGAFPGILVDSSYYSTDHLHADVAWFHAAALNQAVTGTALGANI
jgi:hypothetical protein